MILAIKTKFTRTNLNSIAMVSERVIENVANLVVVAVIARIFGPHIFAIFGLAQAAFGIGMPAATAVGEQILIQYQVQKERNPKLLLKKAIVIKYVMSTVIYLITFTFSYFYFDDQVFYTVVIFCLMHFVNLDKIFFSYFRAREEGHKVLVAKLAVIIPFSVAKIVAVCVLNELLWVAFLYVLEALFLSMVSAYQARRSIKTDNVHSVISTKITELVLSSWPIFTSATLVAAYARIDQFMIEHYLARDQLGYYSAAVKISLMIQYILATFLASRFPQMLRIHKVSAAKYLNSILKLMRMCLLGGLAFTVFLVFFGESVIVFTFGQKFLPANDILVVSSLGTIFVFYGMLCTQWLLAADLQRLQVYRVLGGLVVNVLLNIWMIPAFGIMGAAISTVISQLVASVLLNLIHPMTRPFFFLQLYSIVPYFKWKTQL